MNFVHIIIVIVIYFENIKFSCQGGWCRASLLASTDKRWKIVDFGTAKRMSLYLQETGSNRAFRRNK